MPRTPITDLPVEWRESTGHDDLLLVEGRADLATAVRVLERRADFAAGAKRTPGSADAADADVAVSSLPVGDIDALIVALRIDRLGDRLIAEGTCHGCSAAVDVEFSLAAYLGHNRPRRTGLARPAAEPGWWRLLRHDLTFRVPSAGDVLDAGSGPGARASLLAACFRGDLRAPAIRAAERALARIAPVLRTTVRGVCPECRAPVDMDVDARGLALAELGFLAGSVLDEVHRVAAAYHWTERAILDLPSSRRTAYAERVRIARDATVPLEVAGG
jgi:hypothetical protein